MDTSVSSRNRGSINAPSVFSETRNSSVYRSSSDPITMSMDTLGIASSGGKIGVEAGNDSDDDDSDNGGGDDDDVNDLRTPDGIPFITSSNRDIDLEDQVGYSAIQMLRGRSTGRRIKRNLFFFGCVQMGAGIALSVIADCMWSSFTVTEFFKSSKHGKRLIDLMYLIAVLGILFGLVTFMMVRYWSSLVSNRFLLSGVMKLYVLCCLVKWIFTIATLIVVFQTFGEVPRWGVGVDRETNSMLPLYVWTVLFMLPYMLLLFYFGMDFSYLNEEIEFGK